MPAQPLCSALSASSWMATTDDLECLLKRARAAFRMPIKTGQLDLSAAILSGRVVLAIRDSSKAAYASENPCITNALIKNIVRPLHYDLVKTQTIAARVYYEFERSI